VENVFALHQWLFVHQTVNANQVCVVTQTKFTTKKNANVSAKSALLVLVV
jgi:hypothetical protein